MEAPRPGQAGAHLADEIQVFQEHKGPASSNAGREILVSFGVPQKRRKTLQALELKRTLFLWVSAPRSGPAHPHAPRGILQKKQNICKSQKVSGEQLRAGR